MYLSFSESMSNGIWLRSELKLWRVLITLCATAKNGSLKSLEKLKHMNNLEVEC